MRGRGQTVDLFLMRDSPRESGGRPRFHAVTAPRLLVAVGERLPSIHYIVHLNGHFDILSSTTILGNNWMFSTNTKCKTHIFWRPSLTSLDL